MGSVYPWAFVRDDWYGMGGGIAGCGARADAGYLKWYIAEKMRTGRGRPEAVEAGGSGARYTSWMIVYTVGSGDLHKVSQYLGTRGVP